AWVIEPGRQWQCHAQPHAAVAESPLPQSLLFLQYYLQNARTFTLPGDRVQWQWSRA
ncbi:beta-ketoacyl synthase chain length factor, partial [Klebsiella pneumoniae]|nr:beta-ketoacyl synthase chain length factor [Klebsiella pneumoniae]